MAKLSTARPSNIMRFRCKDSVSGNRIYEGPEKEARGFAKYFGSSYIRRMPATFTFQVIIPI